MSAMGMFDKSANPSDGRFEAPDPSRFDPPSGGRPRAWLIPALLVLIYLLRFELHSFRGTGWLAAAAGLGVFALMIAEYVVVRREQLKDEDPYTRQQHLTR
jgi:hypothetical protein